MTKPELIIFDCDGVLVDSEAISARVLVEELAKIGVACSVQEVFDRFVGRSLTDVLTSLQLPSGTAEPDAFGATYLAAVLDAFAHELEAMHGVREVIAQLGVACCVATSSSPQRVAGSLSKCGLDGFFGDNVFTASQVENGKPAPDLFLFAAENMGVAPESCLVIEDSLPGVQAAQAAAMRVWRFTGGAHFANMRADIAASPDAIPTFDAWDGFFALDPQLKAGTS